MAQSSFFEIPIKYVDISGSWRGKPEILENAQSVVIGMKLGG